MFKVIYISESHHFESHFSCCFLTFCSEAEDKGSDCLEQFKQMQECFQKHPELYKDFDDDEEEEEEEKEGKKEAGDSEEKREQVESISTSQQLTAPPKELAPAPSNPPTASAAL